MQRSRRPAAADGTRFCPIFFQVFIYLGIVDITYCSPFLSRPFSTARVNGPLLPLSTGSRSYCCCRALYRSNMSSSEIEYSEKYFDDEFEYRCGHRNISSHTSEN